MRKFFSTFFTETFFHSYLLTMLRRVGGKAKNTVGSNNPCGRDFWLCETMRHAIHSILWQNYKKVRILLPRINTSYMMYNRLQLLLYCLEPSINDVTQLRGRGRSAKRWHYAISLFSKMDDKGERGIKNLKKCMALCPKQEFFP